jgi:hypothetical protein
VEGCAVGLLIAYLEDDEVAQQLGEGAENVKTLLSLLKLFS